MQKHWDRWGWIVAVAIIAVGFLRLMWGREAFCGEDTEHCFREWVSALGGWAAVAAAVPTIFYLSRQVKDAEKHQRTNFAIQLRRQRILAQHIQNVGNEARLFIRVYLNNELSPTANDVRKWDPHTAKEMTEMLRSDAVRSFETEIAFPKSMSGRTTAEVLERGRDGEEPHYFVASEIVESYWKNIVGQADAFIAEVTVTTSHD
ncbi:hypothetical protein DXT96_07455 [Agrobacterium sp. ICMP 6402]|uniref:hypothetical protein n=1 Tax=Agrobacterium sp. ICMP 6402 TaxID=2292443 RepID=UPI001294B1B9|nr:hypothetical protein [Agrobacterium sp. ICMP 6402]MQB09690.1 hypothetical protein [Agrobacterium sp. ICMP 6402]